jgi:two-component system phosphate regulon sensor histidine kinase PhoR
MVITVRARVMKIGYFLGLVIVAFIVFLGMQHFFGARLPDIITIGLYLAPLFLVTVVMMYALIENRRMLLKTQSHERTLALSQERFEYLYKNSPIPYINIDKEGKIFMVNLAAVRLFCSSEKKIIGKSLLEYLTHENESKLSILVHQLQNQVSLSDVEIQFTPHTGDTRWILLSVFADSLQGGLLVSLIDITRQKKVDIAKTEFATLASHQLRTPIAAIRWNLELLESLHSDSTEEQKKYYFKINRNVERLVSLVNDFLNVSKLELGTFATSPEKIELAGFIDTTFEEFEKLIEDKKLQVVTDYQPDSVVGEFDARLLRIILGNLISNACKYTPQGGTITVSYVATQKEVSLTVSDTGIGIPVEEIEKIFTRFYRASNAESQHTEGTGLGLYIIKAAVKKLSGTVTVQSQLGKGSIFTIMLPYKKLATV